MQADPHPDGYGQLLWTPSAERVASSRLAHYQAWLAEHEGVRTTDYHGLWRWSVDHIEDFWASIWRYFDVVGEGPLAPVLGQREMPGATWFPNTRLNYAENTFRQASAERPALLARSEDAPWSEVSWAELERDTAALAARLRELGIGPGDRVASYMPNRAETVVAFLACASIGAIWSSCAPDMGPTVVLDRLRQIEPTLLFATDSYSYNGKRHDRAPQVDELLAALPSVRHVVQVPGPLQAQRGACPSTTRCGSSTPRAPRACPRPWCTATVASCSPT